MTRVQTFTQTRIDGNGVKLTNIRNATEDTEDHRII